MGVASRSEKETGGRASPPLLVTVAEASAGRFLGVSARVLGLLSAVVEFPYFSYKGAGAAFGILSRKAAALVRAGTIVTFSLSSGTTWSDLSDLFTRFKGVVFGRGKLASSVPTGTSLSAVFRGEIFFLPFKINDANDVSGNPVFFSNLCFIGVVFETPREVMPADALDFPVSAGTHAERASAMATLVLFAGIPYCLHRA